MERLKLFCKENKLIIIIFIWAFVASFIVNVYALFAVEILSFVFVLICGIKPRVDISDTLLGLGMFFFYFFDERSFLLSCILAGEVLIVYQIGKIIAFNEYNNSKNSILISIMIIAFVFWVYGIIDYSRVVLNPNMCVGEKWKYLFYSSYIPRTQHEFWFVLSSSLLPVLVLLNSKSIRLRIAGIAIGMTGLALSVYMEGRIAFFICLINTVLLISLLVIKKWKMINKKRLSTTIVMIVTIIVILIIMFNSNIMGLNDIYEDSMWSGGGGFVHNTRTYLWKQGLERVINSPMGYRFGENDLLTSPRGFRSTLAHNSWIDIGLKSGIASFTLIVLFTLLVMYRLIMVFIRNNNDSNYYVISAYGGLFLYNFVEPGICANRVFWFTFILICGMIANVNVENYEGL